MFAYHTGETSETIYIVDLMDKNSGLFLILGIILIIGSFFCFDYMLSMSCTIFFAALLYQVYQNTALIVVFIISGLLWSIINRDYYLYRHFARNNLSDFLNMIFHIIKISLYAFVISSCFIFKFGFDKYYLDNKSASGKSFFQDVLVILMPWLCGIVIGYICRIINNKLMFKSRGLFFYMYFLDKISCGAARTLVVIRLLVVAAVILLLLLNYKNLSPDNAIPALAVSVLMFIYTIKVLLTDISNRRYIVPLRVSDKPEQYHQMIDHEIKMKMIKAGEYNPFER